MKHRRRLVLPLLVFISCLSAVFPAQAQVSGDSSILDTTTKDTLQTVQRGTKIYKATFDSEVTYSAKDSIVVKMKERKVILYGDAVMHYGEMEVQAPIIEIDFRSRVLHAIPFLDSVGRKLGFAKIIDDGEEFQADTIDYDFDSKRGVIKGLITSVQGGLVSGKTVKKDEFDNLYIKEARYTTCNDTADPHFHIQADRMKVIPKKKIVSGPAFLYVGNVPTPGFLPFGYFPITDKRSSGIIMPNYGYSPDRGYFLRNGGYYFGINDYVDMALTGDIYANLSWRANAMSYYAKRYKFSGNLSVEYARLKNGEREDLNYFIQNSYFIRWNHAMDFKARPNTTFNANVNFGSSNFLRLNSYDQQDIVQNSLNSSVNYSRVFGGGKSSLNVGLNHSQNNQTRSMNLAIPNVTYDVMRFFPFRKGTYSGEGKWYEEIGMSYQTRFSNQLNTYDSLLGRPDILKKQLQYGMVHSLPVQANFKVLKYLNFVPGVNFNSFMYMSSTRRSWDAAEKEQKLDTVQGFTAAYSYDTYANFSTILYGTMQTRGKIKAIRHVLTPSVGFSYRPDFSEERYGFYRDVQSDSTGLRFERYSIFEQGIFRGPEQGEMGALNFSLNHNLEAKIRKQTDSGEVDEKIRIFDFFTMGGNYNFLADSLKLSNIGFNSQTTLLNQFVLQFSATLDPYALDTGMRRMDEFEVQRTGSIGRFVSGRFTLVTSLNSETFKKGEKKEAPQPLTRNPYMNSQDLAMLNMPGGFVDFNIPWNLSVNYIYSYIKPGLAKDAQKIKNLNFSGDFSLTQKWKIGFSSGYDFNQKNLTMTSIDFYRDLHCWEFRFNWVPFGDRQFFNFGLNAKASVLQDLKLNRRRDWYDR